MIEVYSSVFIVLQTSPSFGFRTASISIPIGFSLTATAIPALQCEIEK